MKKHTEDRLEDAIIAQLCEHDDYRYVDYRDGEARGENDRPRYDKARALDPLLVLEFIKNTQEKVWNSLQAIHGEETAELVLDHLGKELDTKGVPATRRPPMAVIAAPICGARCGSVTACWISSAASCTCKCPKNASSPTAARSRRSARRR